MCRLCGRIYIRGREVALPEKIRDAMREVASEAAASGKEAREGLELDPEQRIEKWFSLVYQRGYLHGFFRALAYFQHHAKEGRLVRLRELWGEAEVCTGKDPVVMFTPAAYNEFEQLLQLSFGVRLNAKSSSDTDAARQDRDAHVPRQTGQEKTRLG